MPVQRLSKVLEIRKLTEDAFLLRLDAPDIADTAAPGQFVHIKCGAEQLLRRPISICNAEAGVLTVVVEARGAGTRWLAGRQPGQTVDLLGPLGNGYDVAGGRLLLIGGGIGAPPLLYAARKAAGRVTSVLGFRTAGCVILQDEFQTACDAFCLTTDDGTAGERGFVTDVSKRLLDENRFDAVLACGPKPMLKAVAALTREYGVSCQVSLEERMGCGVGACLVCACKTVKDGSEHMSRVCRDGPVFNAQEVVWE